MAEIDFLKQPETFFTEHRPIRGAVQGVAEGGIAGVGSATLAEVVGHADLALPIGEGVAAAAALSMLGKLTEYYAMEGKYFRAFLAWQATAGLGAAVGLAFGMPLQGFGAGEVFGWYNFNNGRQIRKSVNRSLPPTVTP